MSTAELDLQAHRERLLEYVEAMKPGRPISMADGVIQQRKLWNCIQLTLMKQDAVFIAHYSEFLAIIAANRKGAFNDRYVFRFINDMALSADDLSNFRKLLNLMLRTCEIGSRQLSIRQIDLRTTLSGLMDEQQRQRVASFYEL